MHTNECLPVQSGDMSRNHSRISPSGFSKYTLACMRHVDTRRRARNCVSMQTVEELGFRDNPRTSRCFCGCTAVFKLLLPLANRTAQGYRQMLRKVLIVSSASTAALLADPRRRKSFSLGGERLTHL